MSSLLGEASVQSMWWLSLTLASWLGGAGETLEAVELLRKAGARGEWGVEPRRADAKLDQVVRDLELHGRARHLPLLWKAYRESDDVPEVRTGKIQRALLAILAADARSPRWLLQTREQIPEELRATVVATTRQGLGSRVVDLWQAWIEDHEYEPWILAELGALGPEVLMHRRTLVSRWARARLDAEDRHLRSLAVDAVGHLRDGSSAKRLVELLGDEDQEITRKAARALARLSGQDLGSRPEGWKLWLRTQVELWNQVPLQLEQVHQGEDDDAFHVLRELQLVTLRRHQLALELLPELEHTCARRAAAVAETLGALGSEEALTGLVRALDRSDLVVQSAAWRALKAITHEDLGFDSESWHRALFR